MFIVDKKNDIKIKNKDIIDYLPLKKIQTAVNKLTKEKLLSYYHKSPFDTEESIKIIHKSKLVFNVYLSTGDKLCTEAFIEPYQDVIIPPKTITNLKNWMNGQISDGFGENGMMAGKYLLFMGYRKKGK